MQMETAINNLWGAREKGKVISIYKFHIHNETTVCTHCAVDYTLYCLQTLKQMTYEWLPYSKGKGQT